MIGESLAVSPTLSEPELLRFLAGRRWFGAKARDPVGARVARTAVVRSGDVAAAVTRIDVRLSRGATEHYQLPLTVRASRLVDATEDPWFRAAVATIFAEGGATFDEGDARWVVEPVGRGAAIMSGVSEGHLSQSEQSNTSIRYGDAAILKLFRRLEAGEHPDLEIARFLTTRARFEHTPELLGTIHFEDERGRSAAAMLQRLVPGATDAWSYVLGVGRQRGRPDGADAPDEWLETAERLGVVTRTMHDALASGSEDPDFAPEPVTREDLDRWREAVRQRAQDALALMAGALAGGGLGGDDAALARLLAMDRERLMARTDAIHALIGDDAGQRIRHHGDYHLGQVLRAADGALFVIDFEGEPARPLEERRQKHSPLRDVAGMLRSFSYAAATIARETGRNTASWERAMRDRFLDAYASPTSGPGAGVFLPSTESHTVALLELFELEKALYEVAYELNNRPDWASIPMRAVAAMLAGAGSEV